MARSLLVSLSSCACVALLLSPGSAVAQGFTEADLVGDYAFRAQETGGTAFSMHFVGRLTADGLGGVTGSRTISRPLTNSVNFGFLREQVTQELTGTYSVESDGTGVMTVVATPNPDWMGFANLNRAVSFDRPETLRFALADGGRQFLITVDVPARLYRETDGVDIGRVEFALEGQALAQEPSTPEPDPRIDALQAQLCELIRLMHTPQGQRETSTPEVLDACGTGYQWNGEGSRRGR